MFQQNPKISEKPQKSNVYLVTFWRRPDPDQLRWAPTWPASYSKLLMVILCFEVKGLNAYYEMYFYT